MYAIFGCASDFGYNFRHLTPTTLNCGATVHWECLSNSKIYHNCIAMVEAPWRDPQKTVFQMALQSARTSTPGCR